MGPLTTRTPRHVMLSFGPSVLVRPVGRHIGAVCASGLIDNALDDRGC
jgi:hypothetical protein